MVNEEKQFLTSHLNRAAKPSNLMIVGLYAATMVVLLAATGMGYLAQSLFGPLLALSVIASSIIPLMWIEQIREYQEDLGDISLGEVELYQADNASLSLNRMVYLPRSGRVLSQQGTFLNRRRYLRVNLVAPNQGKDQSLFPRQFSYENDRLHIVRSLSKFERLELKALVPKDRNWRWLLPAVLWSWFGIGVAYACLHGMSFSTLLRISLLVIAAISLTTYYGYRWYRKALLVKDMRQGRVICEVSGIYEFEHLEKSAFVWTVDSMPAPWRKRSVLSWFCALI